MAFPFSFLSCFPLPGFSRPFSFYGVYRSIRVSAREAARFHRRLVSRAGPARKRPALKVDGTVPSRSPVSPSVYAANERVSLRCKIAYVQGYTFAFSLLFLVTRKGIFCFTQEI